MPGPCEPVSSRRSPRPRPRDREGLEDPGRHPHRDGQAGLKRSDYRLICRPTLRRPARRRRPLRAPTQAHGCPFYDSDALGARRRRLPVGNAVQARRGATTPRCSTVGNAFEGHEFCAKSDRQATATDHPDAAHSEWGRIITLRPRARPRSCSTPTPTGSARWHVPDRRRGGDARRVLVHRQGRDRAHGARVQAHRRRARLSARRRRVSPARR